MQSSVRQGSCPLGQRRATNLRGACTGGSPLVQGPKEIGSEHFLPRRKTKGSNETRKIACSASYGSDIREEVERLILRTAGRCKVRSGKGRVPWAAPGDQSTRNVQGRFAVRAGTEGDWKRSASPQGNATNRESKRAQSALVGGDLKQELSEANPVGQETTHSKDAGNSPQGGDLANGECGVESKAGDRQPIGTMHTVSGFGRRRRARGRWEGQVTR